MDITNGQLLPSEAALLAAMLNDSGENESIIINQINNSHIRREGNGYYASILFEVNSGVQKLTTHTRVPIEMHLWKKDEAPIALLLHVIDGYINELEIYKGDLSGLPFPIVLYDYRKEILYYW